MPSPRSASPELQNAMDEVSEAVNRTIERLLPETDLAEAELYEAMRHGVLGGGKRLRPFLCMQSAFLFNVPSARARRVAAAIEFMHCYSLIHDDLPAMDDASLRRGQPTVHKQYDDATAILAGDALLTLAFEILADPETHPDPHVQTELVRELAKASGGHGMVGGQMLDLIAERDDVDFDVGEISRLQRMKTGKLMAFACEAGAILGKAGDAQRKALCNFAHDLGLAFQVTDDILDVEGDETAVGKAVGKDADAGKATFVSLLGLDAAKARAQELVTEAQDALSSYGEDADLLRKLAQFVITRDR